MSSKLPVLVLFAAAKTMEKTLNCYIWINKSEEDGVALICVRGGRQRVAVEATRATKCNYPFKVTGQKEKDGLWNAFMTNATDYHPPIVAFISCCLPYLL